MTVWREAAPGLAGPWGQKVASNSTSTDLETQYRRALDAMARWRSTPTR